MKGNLRMNINIITHYEIDDVKFNRDYTSIDIEIDGKEMIEYGDFYHDRGQEKAEGFLDCLDILKKLNVINDVIVTETDIADFEY